MNKKSLLKFLPVIILTATQITTGMDGKPGNKSNTINNYHAPVNNNSANNIYNGNVVNNQYPMCYGYGILPVWILPNLQYFPIPNIQITTPNIQLPTQNIQNSQYNPFQQYYYYCYPTFSNNAWPNKNNDNQIPKKSKLNINSKEDINENINLKKDINENINLKKDINENINSKKDINQKTILDNFFAINNANNIKKENGYEQLDRIMENDLFIQNIITPIIGESPKKQEEMDLQITFQNNIFKSLGLILQNSIGNTCKQINGKILLNKLKEIQKQDKIKNGLEIINKYNSKKLNKHNPIIEKLTNGSYKTLQDIFEILNNQEQYTTETKNIKTRLLNNLKDNLKKKK